MSKNVGNLGKNLQATGPDSEAFKSNLIETESALTRQSQVLQQASIQFRVQKAIDEAVSQSSEDEAEVYKQGSKFI